MSARFRLQTQPSDDRSNAGDDAARPTAAPVAYSELPASWLARVLEVACRLPLDDGPEAVAAAVLAVANELLPNHGFAVVLPGAGPLEVGTVRTLRSRMEPGLTMTPGGHARLLAEYPHVRALELTGQASGVTLHAGASEASALVEGGSTDLLLRQLGDLLASALRNTGLLKSKGREWSELRGQIIQSEKLASLGQIAASVVHELNNPLTCIVGYSDYLRQKAVRDRSDPEDIERLRRMGEAADRIMRFCNDLIAYARPSIERPAPVSLHAIIDQALVFCEHVLRAAHVEVARAFASEVGPVLGVRDQLTQVFVNLFTNACHAMEGRGGTLAIITEVDPSGRAIHVVVGDSGHGIDPAIAKRIFEPFFTTKTEGRGTGLGLSIVHNIVVLHGGTIAVEETSRMGTRFALTMPLASSLAPSA